MDVTYLLIFMLLGYKFLNAHASVGLRGNKRTIFSHNLNFRPERSYGMNMSSVCMSVRLVLNVYHAK